MTEICLKLLESPALCILFRLAKAKCRRRAAFPTSCGLIPAVLCGGTVFVSDRDQMTRAAMAVIAETV